MSFTGSKEKDMNSLSNKINKLKKQLESGESPKETLLRLAETEKHPECNQIKNETIEEKSLEINDKREKINHSTRQTNSRPNSNSRRIIETLKEDLSRRQESYIRRERVYQNKIEDLKKKLIDVKNGQNAWMEGTSKIESIRNMHSKLLSNIEGVKEETSKILQEQERDLLRAFRARLFDVQSELEAERSRQDEGVGAWIEKNRQLQRELDWAKEMADRLEQMNQTYVKENSSLKSKFKTQDDDREFLIRQLVAVKKDNTKLRQDLEETSKRLNTAESNLENLEQERKKGLLSKQKKTLMPQYGKNTNESKGLLPLVGQSTVSTSSAALLSKDTENRYKEIIRRLKKLLETERKSLKQVRIQYSADLQQRTELEIFLRQCIQDVKHEISKERFNQASQNYEDISKDQHSSISSSNNVGISFDGLTVEERREALELLLSKERVVQLLHEKTFPRSRSITTNSTPEFVETRLGSQGQLSIYSEHSANNFDHFPVPTRSEIDDIFKEQKK